VTEVLVGSESGRQRKIGKPVAEIGEREAAAIGDLERIANRLGGLAKQLDDLRRRLEMTLGVRQQPPARAVEGQLLANASEHVEQRSVSPPRMSHVVRDREPHTFRSSEVGEKAIAALFLRIEMAL
jgi:hypothetical protein